MTDLELYHYGVKGMKWGVRKDEYHSMSRSQKKEVRRDYKWRQKVTGARQYEKVRQKAYGKYVDDLYYGRNKALNYKPSEDRDEHAKRVKREIDKYFVQSFDEVVETVSPSGKYRAEMFIQDCSLASVPDKTLFTRPVVRVVDND